MSFQIFIQIVRLLESKNWSGTTNDLRPKKTYQWMLWISVVRIGMVLQKLQCFVMWIAGILTDFYKELIEIGARLAFLFGTGCTMWGIWKANSGRSNFHIVDAIFVSEAVLAVGVGPYFYDFWIKKQSKI